MKTFILIATLLITITHIHIAYAGVIGYNVVITFLDDTTFTGSFNYDAAKQQVTNLRGIMNDYLMGNIEFINYQIPSPSSESDGKGGIIGYAFELNTNVIGTNPPKNNNAGVGINFNAVDPTLGATDLGKLAYMDCSPGGLMGQTCM